MTEIAAPVDARRTPGRGRLVGVDVARGVALVGMMAAHVLPARTDDGGATASSLIAAGRSAALFAVLAGVGIALSTGGRRPLRGEQRARASMALVVRGALVGAVGLLLPLLGAGVAVILAYYAVLFVVAVPLLGLGPRRLAGLGVGVALLAPLLAYAVQDGLTPRPRASPGFAALTDDPVGLLEVLLVTGYYPVLGWTAYLCAGLALGRLALGSTRVALWLLAGGVALALLAAGASAVLLGPLGGLEQIAAVTDLQGERVEDVVDRGRFGTVPTTTLWWLATDAPHSTTPPDLLHTTGTALAVLGAALLLAGVAGRLVAPLAAVGSMPLTLYCLHLVVLGLTGVTGNGSVVSWLAQVVGALVLATLWRRGVGRGPLEALLAAVVRPLRGR